MLTYVLFIFWTRIQVHRYKRSLHLLISLESREWRTPGVLNLVIFVCQLLLLLKRCSVCFTSGALCGSWVISMNFCCVFFVLSSPTSEVC
jgi:hypothetical protein